MEIFGIDVAELVNEHIAPGLNAGSIIRKTTTRNVDNPSQVDITSTSSTCKLVEVQNKQEFLSRGLKVGEAKIYLIVANSISPIIVPEPGDQVVFNGVTLNITAGGVEADPAGATYTVVCRS